jgi:aerobic carbon-monoxide dehydrogenase large subunit
MVRETDRRVLVGKGTYLDDIKLPGMLHVAFVRSPYSHAKIGSIDPQAALRIPGIHAVFTGADLCDRIKPLPRVPPVYQTLVPRIQLKIRPPSQRALAVDRARYVGEPVAALVAISPALAADAVEHIRVEYEMMPAVVDPELALEGSAPLLFPEWGDNIAVAYTFRTGDSDRAMQTATHRVRERFYFHRQTANPIETRGIIAEWDSQQGRLTEWSSTQVPYPLRDHLAETLGLERANVRVITPDVGGGFGAKCVIYPEEIAVAYMAKEIGSPLKWVEHRREHMLTTVHARDQLHEVEVGFEEDGTITALRLRIIGDSGAYSPYHLNPTFNTVSHLPGPYRIQNYEADVRVAVTNKAPTAPYRGAGRPEGSLVMERVIDRVARQLGLEPALVRSHNLIRADEMPFDTGRLYKDGEQMIYDGGDYQGCLEKALDKVGFETFRKRQKQFWSKNRYLGLGIAAYVEGTGQGPRESARVRINENGSIDCFVSTPSQGQGHDTVFPQICGEALGVDPSRVRSHAEDTEQLSGGRGTYGSRSVVVAGSAVHLAAKKVREEALQRGSKLLEISTDDLEIRDGLIWSTLQTGVERSLSYQEAAVSGPPLEAEEEFTPTQCTYAYGVHTLTLEVFPETGEVEILKYVVCDDAGRLINPEIADGQILGGVVQGIGGALFEELIYDENGQLVTGSFTDYPMPRFPMVPPIEIIHMATPSPRNPLGVRGLGEAGTIPPAAAIANAVEDALKPFGVKINRLPLSPPRLWQLIVKAKEEAAEHSDS